MPDPDDHPGNEPDSRAPARPLPPPPTLGELFEVARQRFALRHPSFDATHAVLVVAALAGLGGMVWALTVGRGDPGPVEPVRVVAASTAPATTVAVTSTTAPGYLVVDVAGAVVRPGPVRVRDGARVVDAIDAAGGARSDADLERVVRAARLTDGQRVYVPRRGQTEIPEVIDPTGTADPGGGAAGGGGPPASATAAAGPVNLNTADAATLDTLPGVGPATAQAIIDHRTRNGPFGSVDDLLAVKGIGPAKLAELRPRVTV